MKKPSKLVSFLSGLYLLASMILLLWVCGFCYPQSRAVFAGLENSPVRQAFGTLADGLEAGIPIRETVSEAAQVLFVSQD